MKVIIPSAGVGTRLHPHTHTKPKPMVSVAGKPIIGHILDRLIEINPEEVIIVVGYMKDTVINYVSKNYLNKFNKISFVHQKQRLGLGHSIYVCKSAVFDSQILITLGDMIFKEGYKYFLKEHKKNGETTGSIGVKIVDNPQHYGIVELKDNIVKSLIEKPKVSKSNLAIAGVYFITDTTFLFKTLEYMIENKIVGSGKEYQLTDALSRMVEKGAVFKTFEVTGWYDCGRPDTLLEANRILLSEKSNDLEIKSCIINKPVAIGKDVIINNSIIGPSVSIADNTFIENSIISDSIIGSGSTVKNVSLRHSLIGDNVQLEGKYNTLNIGDSSSVQF